MDQTIYVEKTDKKAVKENKYYSPSMLSLLGSSDGTLFVYDPIMVEPDRIKRYNQDEK